MAKKTSKKSSKKTIKKTAKKTAKKVTKKAAKKVSKKTTKKTAKKKARKQSAAVIQSESLKPGDMAPDFTLPDQNGKMVSLHDYRGAKNVLVYFYPRAMTPGCTVQACGLRDVESRLNDLDVVVLGISADHVKKLKQFEEKEKLNFTLLSDADHKVAEAYHSWGLKKFMGREFMGLLRQSFLVDKDGKIVTVMHKVDTSTHHETVIEFFKNQK
jgi:peroxiredoxin Q/BCP